MWTHGTRTLTWKDDDIKTWGNVSQFWPHVASRSSAIIITIQKAAEDLPWSDNKVELQPFDDSTAKNYLLGRPDAGFTNEQQQDEKADTSVSYPSCRFYKAKSMLLRRVL